MNGNRSIARRFFLALLAVAVLGAGAGQSLANHDPNIIHACVKNGSIQIVSSAADCKSGETPVALVTEASLQDADAALNAKIDDVEALAKRLHGNTAAVLDGSDTGTTNGLPGYFVIQFKFCTVNDILNNNCGQNPSLAFETGHLIELDEGSSFTFNAVNVPQFSAIVDLLTNGVADFFSVSAEYYNPNGSPVGGATTAQYETYWFNLYPQVSSGPGIVDLTGLNISGITVSVDRLSLYYNTNTHATSRNLDFRVFFDLAN